MPLEDMSPLLDMKVLKKEMIIDLTDTSREIKEKVKNA